MGLSFALKPDKHRTGVGAQDAGGISDVTGRIFRGLVPAGCPARWKEEQQARISGMIVAQS